MEAELERLRGELLLAAGKRSDVVEAEACFQRAMDVARKQRARAWELRAASSLARLWHRQGRPRDAQRLLAEATASFTEGFDTRDLRSAKDLLDWLARA